MRFFWLHRALLAPQGEGTSGGAGAGEGTKPDGRTERALQDDVARIGADVERLKIHTGIDHVLEDDDPPPDLELQEKGLKDDGEAGVDDILADGLTLGDEDDDEEQAA